MTPMVSKPATELPLIIVPVVFGKTPAEFSKVAKMLGPKRNASANSWSPFKRSG